MGLGSILTSPFRFAGHVAKGTVGRGFSAIGGEMSANASLSKLRLNLRSYEGMAYFDSNHLARHIKVYNRIKKRIQKYKSEKQGNAVVCKKIAKLIEKHKKNPTHLNKILIHEVGIFAGYYRKLLEALSTLLVEQSHEELCHNAATIRDTEKLKGLLNSLANSKTSAIVTEDMIKTFKEGIKIMEKEDNEIKKEYSLRQLEIRGEYGLRKATRRAGGFFVRMHGINRLAHKARKTHKKILHIQQRDFNQNFQALQEEINKKKVSPVTISRAQYLLKNYKKIRKYYHDIEQDFVLIYAKLMEDFDEISSEHVIPFYASVRHVKGSSVIMFETGKLKETYKNYMKELQKEEFELKKVHQEFLTLKAACLNALEALKQHNSVVMQNLQKTMTVGAK